MLLYLLKVIICSGILFGYYWLALRNKIFHQYNRFYLLAAIVVSLTLPLLQINIWHNETVEQKSNVIKVLEAVTAGDEYMGSVVTNNVEQPINAQQFLPIVYAFVSLLLLVMFIQSLATLYTLIKKYQVQKIQNIAFINTDNAKGTPFSFFRYIFWNRDIDMNTTEGKQIFKHELAHIEEKHSYDKIFINLVMIFFWCNPFFWLMRRELNAIHEFIADKKAVEDNDTASLAAMILQATYPKNRFQITNPFFYSSIKRRLAMLTKNQNPKVNYFGRLLVLPLAVIIIAVFSFKVKDNHNIYNGKKITVVIDAGHGGTDAGARSSSGILEKDLTLALAKKVKALNTNNDIEIILLREEDVYQHPTAKADFANNKKADLLISFHIDSDPKINQKSGMSFFVARDQYANAAKSKVFAQSLINEFGTNYGLPVVKGVTQHNTGIWLLQESQMPSVLIEAGYINNATDLAYLQTNAAQETIAKNVLTAIEKYLTRPATDYIITDTVPDKLPTAQQWEKAAVQTEPKKFYNGTEIIRSEILKNQDVQLTLVDGKKITMNQPEAFKRGLFTPPPPPPGSNAPNNNKLINGMIKALIVVDGEIKDKNFNPDELNSNDIESIDILKDGAATAKYGDKGKNGVILITTKKANSSPVIKVRGQQLAQPVIAVEGQRLTTAQQELAPIVVEGQQLIAVNDLTTKAVTVTGHPIKVATNLSPVVVEGRPIKVATTASSPITVTGRPVNLIATTVTPAGVQVAPAKLTTAVTVQGHALATSKPAAAISGVNIQRTDAISLALISDGLPPMLNLGGLTMVNEGQHIVVDGKAVDSKFNGTLPGKYSIRFLDKKEAVQKYGSVAGKGAIELTTIK